MTNTKQDWLKKEIKDLLLDAMGDFPTEHLLEYHARNFEELINQQIEKEVVEAYKQGYIDGGIGVMNETANYHPKQSKEANDE